MDSILLIISNANIVTLRIFSAIIIPIGRLLRIHLNPFYYQEMVDRSHLVVCCVEHNSAGAYKTVEYARRRGKEIINLADCPQTPYFPTISLPFLSILREW